MNKNSGLSCLLKLLMVQLIIFSISNLIIVIIDTYESLFRGDNLNPEKFINLKVLIIPILISIIIICIYIHLYKIKKAYLLIKKIDVKVLLLLVIPFLLSVIIIFLGNVYREVLVYINYDLIRINKYTIILLLVFIIITITLIYTLIKIIKNKGLLISKIGLRLIFIVGIVFIASMVLLNIMRKFIESYLLGYGNMDPKKFARIYNTVSLGFIIVVIVTCILVILSIVNKWVQYLNYMILKLRRISEIQYVDDLDINGDDELSELASSINVMSNKLKDNYEREKKIEKEKNDFIVAVSHDLRTPLTSIIGYLDLLKNEKIQSYEKTSEYIDITYRKP
ncbi:HAMP domain-containing protein [Clostridium botulinum]|nr:HAMP domain-containing protein [Clostridium botulinum]MBO0576822.1 HAMP domain-containing protein [Clostridium botulinum]